MATMRGKVAVVAGGSRGAGRGIALALGEAGATVYVAGRSRRDGWRPMDGAPGSIDETAEEVRARGGEGIGVPTDCTNEADVSALFAQVERDHGRVDVLANAVWGGADAFPTMESWQNAWGRPYWEQPAALWRYTMEAGPHAYLLMSMYASRLMAAKGGGLIAGITDGYMDGTPEEVLSGKASGDYQGPLFNDLAHTTICRLQHGMAIEGKRHKIAVITLMPGFMRTERVERHLAGNDKLKKQFRYDLSESTLYVGRAVVALAGDRQVLKKTGRIHFVADLAKEYGFNDADGRYVPRFNPFVSA